jgi:hypothetical protein
VRRVGGQETRRDQEFHGHLRDFNTPGPGGKRRNGVTRRGPGAPAKPTGICEMGR